MKHEDIQGEMQHTNGLIDQGVDLTTAAVTQVVDDSAMEGREKIIQKDRQEENQETQH